MEDEMSTTTNRVTLATKKYQSSLAMVAVLALGIGACSSGRADGTPLPTDTTGPATVTPTPSATTVATTTTASTTAPEAAEQPLVLVAFGDSLVSYPSADRAVIGVYASMVEQEFGVPVDVRNHAVWGSSPGALLNALGGEEVQTDLAEADVVLLEIPMGDSAWPFPTAVGWQGRDPADCGGGDHQQCLRDYLAEHKADVEAILAAITDVCDPSETLIRALDSYQMQIEDQIALGSLHITNPYWQEAQNFLDETAATYGIPVAQVYDEFMGPDGTDDPQERGLVMGDQRHPTAAGAELIAEMIRDLGYELDS